MKTSVVNFWNRSNVITQDKEAQLKYSYDQHVAQLVNMQTSRKILVDNTAPYVMKKRNVSLSKPVKERQFAIEQENGALIHKMLEVKKKGGEYSKDHLIKAVQTHSAPKSLFLPLKIATEKKVYEENKSLSTRLRNANSTINFQVMDKDFEKSIKYKDNITKRSRRIYNCFLMEGSFMSGTATTSALNSHSTSRLSKGRYSSMDEIGKKKREQSGLLEDQQHFLELPKKKGKKKQSTKSKQNSMVAEQTGEEDDQENKKQQEQQKNNEQLQAQGIDNNGTGNENTADADKKGSEEAQTKQGQEPIVEQDKTANAN